MSAKKAACNNEKQTIEGKQSSNGNLKQILQIDVVQANEEEKNRFMNSTNSNNLNQSSILLTGGDSKSEEDD